MARPAIRKKPIRRPITEKDETLICRLIEDWARPRITWSALVVVVARELGHVWTRQALERHEKIKTAYRNRREGRTAGKKIIDPAEVQLRKQIETLRLQIADMEAQITAFKDLFIRYQYNAEKLDIPPARLEEPLPLAHRGQTE